MSFARTSESEVACKTVVGASDSRHPKGRIALQYGQGVVKFRKVDIKPM